MEGVGSTYGCGLWSIKVGWDEFKQYIKSEVEDGNCVKFWHDMLSGDDALKELFPLYAIAIDKEASVNSCLEGQEGGIRSWNSRIICDFNHWELELGVLIYFENFVLLQPK